MMNIRVLPRSSGYSICFWVIPDEARPMSGFITVERDYDLFELRLKDEVTINWPAYGSVKVTEARQFAELLRVADIMAETLGKFKDAEEFIARYGQRSTDELLRVSEVF